MKKRRSVQEQAVAAARLRAAVSLQPHRPKVEESAKRYRRTKQKRLWHKDQEALLHGTVEGGGCDLPERMAA
ncbi:MAG: hypothetical protein JWN15_2313 [Firmicutes bacterium]|jgi:hypothetical protein|nr:hypothetical protein [Bacillota bacterium]